MKKHSTMITGKGDLVSVYDIESGNRKIVLDHMRLIKEEEPTTKVIHLTIDETKDLIQMLQETINCLEQENIGE